MSLRFLDVSHHLYFSPWILQCRKLQEFVQLSTKLSVQLDMQIEQPHECLLQRSKHCKKINAERTRTNIAWTIQMSRRVRHLMLIKHTIKI